MIIVIIIVVVVVGIIVVCCLDTHIFSCNIFLDVRARKFWAFPALQTTLKSTIYKEYQLDNNTSIFALAGVNHPYL